MLKPGTIVGKRYRIRHLLAEGGMAEVYLAEHIGNNGSTKLFALKRLLPKLAKNSLFVDMFAHEAALSSSFLHKNIVHCEEFFQDGVDFYLVMEFILGKEVGVVSQLTKTWQVIDRIKFAVAIGQGVCEALSYVHQKVDQFSMPMWIVHGDISPQNIMIDLLGEIKLYDFGAAKMEQAHPFDEKMVRGNLRYMSPEQMAGERLTAGSDIYSLSLILIEIIFGDSRPLDRADPLFITQCIKRLNGLQVKKCISSNLGTLIKQGLSEQLPERFSSCQAMRKCLDLLAQKLSMGDTREYLKQILENDSAVKNPSRRRGSIGIGYFLYFPALAASLGLAIWVVIAICSDLFEPKHQRNLPVWLPIEEQFTLVESKKVLLPTPEVIKKHEHILKQGTLVIRVNPWAEVFIDGEFFGSTPMSALQLPEGRYLVQLRNPNVSAVALKMVKIYADKKTELVHNF